MASGSPAGWYPDPGKDGELRWWDGKAWTGATRESLQQAPAATGVLPAARFEGPRRGALLALAGLLLATAAIVIAAIVLTGGDRTPEPTIAIEGPPPEQPAPDTTNDVEGADAEAPTTDESNAGSDEDTTASEQPDETDGDPDEAAADEAASDDADAEEQSVTVDFDGVCTVEVDGSDTDDLQPWDFDECTSAPVTLSSGQERWIVIVASLSEQEFTQEAALMRSREFGYPDAILHSTHYPSLNPGFWVIFDGPFASIDEARSAAQEAGGGAYPRALSNDDG